MEMTFSLILVLIQMSFAVSLNYNSLNLIGDYFNFKNIHSLNLVLCSKQDAYLTGRFFLFEYEKAHFAINGYYGNTKNIRELIKGQHYRIGVFIDLECEENTQVFNLVSNFGYFNTSYSWLVRSEYLSDPLQRAVLGSTADLAMVGSDNVFYHLQRSRADYDVQTVKLGQWSQTDGLHLAQVPSARPLDGAVMLASIYVSQMAWSQGNSGVASGQPTQDIYDRTDMKKFSEQLQNMAFHDGEDLPNRYSYAVQLCVAKLFNFSIVFTITNHWGAVLPNGTHTGMMGQLQSGEANITLGGSKYLKPRFDVGDPLMTMHEYWFPFVFKQPRVLGSYKALSLPLTPLVWACLGLLIICAAFTFSITHKFGDSKYTEIQESLSGSFLQFAGVVALQGLIIEPYHFSSRLVCLFMLFVGTMVAVFYNGATMNALLSANPPSIKNIEDLVESNIQLALVDALYFTNLPVRNRLLPKIAYDKVDKYMTQAYSLQEGLNLIKQGKAFCAEYFWIYDAVDKYFDEELKCQLSIVLPFPPFPVTSFVTKYTHLRELFNQGILRMKENGLSQRELVRWFPKKPKCQIKQDFVFVRLEAISIALFIVLIGFVLSLMIFVFELRQNYKEKRIEKIPKLKMEHLPPFVV